MLLGSCQDDDIFGWGNGSHRKYGENEVAFTIGGKKGTNTRSDVARTIVAPSNVIDLPTEPGQPQLCLIETVTDMDETFYDAVTGTRGTPVYTENFDQLYSDQLYVTAFEPATSTTGTTTEGQQYTMPSEVWGSYLENKGTVPYKKVADADNTYSYDYSKGQPVNLAWPSGNTLQFFLEAPYSETSKLNRKFTHEGWITFDYTSPTDPKLQKDLLFSSKTITKAQNDEGKAHEILLYHALSGVKFKMGNCDALGEDATIEFKSVQFTSLYSTGNCVIKPNYTDANTCAGDNESNPIKNDRSNAATKSAICTVWKGQSTPIPFTVTFEGVVDAADATKTFPDSFKGSTGEVADDNLNNTDYSQTFLFIPQEISSPGKSAQDVTKIFVSYSITMNGETKPYTVTVNMPTANWKAGELRTYTLDCLNVVVDINDTLDELGVVKSGLLTTNNGTAPQYQRVTLSANWMYNDEELGYGEIIVKPQPIVTMNSDGTITVNKTGFKDFPGTGWVLGSDGFFYYINPVPVGKEPAAPLFDTFTNPYTDANKSTTRTDDDVPYEGAHLEMELCVQAVKFEPTQSSLYQVWDINATSGPYKMTINENGSTTKTNERIFSSLTTEVE